MIDYLTLLNKVDLFNCCLIYTLSSGVVLLQHVFKEILMIYNVF